MITLAELLAKNKDAIVGRWLDDVLATYPGGSAAFGRQKDRFANPVGYSLRLATRGIFEVLLGEMDTEKIGQHLEEIIRIRAVQEFSASQAVGFVFRLKEVVRAEMAGAVGDPRLAPELAEFETRIDQIALTAFDVFVQCREQVCELRVGEMKRQVSWVADKLNRRGVGPELARSDVDVE